MDHALRHLGLSLPLHTGCRRLHAHGRAPKVHKFVELLRGCNCCVLEQMWNVYVCNGDIRLDDGFKLSPYKEQKQNNILNLKRRK